MSGVDAAMPRVGVRGLGVAIAAGSALVAGLLYAGLDVGRGDSPSRRLVFKKEYRLFYAISALFGIRKQIFLVFGTWVLVKLHGVTVGTRAGIYLAASAAGILLRPLMGEVIDWLGERVVLAADEVALPHLFHVVAAHQVQHTGEQIQVLVARRRRDASHHSGDAGHQRRRQDAGGEGEQDANPEAHATIAPVRAEIRESKGDFGDTAVPLDAP